MSNSSLSINNDSDTPPNPLTPPPSPHSPNEEPISCAPLSETENSEKSHEETEVKPENADDSNEIDSTAAAPDGENVRAIATVCNWLLKKLSNKIFFHFFSNLDR